MTKDEAFKLALEVLEEGVQGTRPLGVATLEAIATIKEALAQPEPWEKFCDSNCVWTDHHPDCKLAQPERCSRCGKKLGDVNHIHTCSPQLEQDGKCKYCTDGCPACDARRITNVLL